MKPIVIDIPLQTGKGLNDRIHWRKRARITKQHRISAHSAVHVHQLQSRSKLPFPATITLTRLSAGALDDDNLAGAMKAIRDGVADAFGRADNSPGLIWRYAQERCARGAYGVRITIEAEVQS